MRRLVRFVGPARPESEQATQPQSSTELGPVAADTESDRPLDVGAATGSAEPASDTGMVDAVARESLGD
jgi:hypothetical protein